MTQGRKTYKKSKRQIIAMREKDIRNTAKEKKKKPVVLGRKRQMTGGVKDR